MDEIFAASKIMGAVTFGTASMVFATIPFLIVLVAGLRNIKHNNSGGLSMVGTLAGAYFVHICSCLIFMTIVIMFDEFSFEESKFYTQKIFGIFWAKDQASVFSAAGVSEKTTDILSAYASLHMAQVVSKYFLLSTAALVTISGAVYGAYLGGKDTYKQASYISIGLFSVVCMICMSILWIAWAKIASFAMFFPQGDMIAYLQDFLIQMAEIKTK